MTNPSAITAPLLAASGLVRSYSGSRVVDGFALELCAGEIVGILGPRLGGVPEVPAPVVPLTGRVLSKESGG